MGSLGSIFDGTEAPADGARGEDLRVDVQVPRSALGSDRGFEASVPATLEKDGRTIARVRGPGHPESVPLHLPADFKSGSVLRLRRQGGVQPGGVPGDLFLRIEVVEGVEEIDAPAGAAVLWTTLTVAGGALAGALWTLLQ